MFTSKFGLFDKGYLLHLKHKYHIDTAAQVLYRDLMTAFV